ncbi:MAG: dephospho-CoA kinase [Chloroflexia bacterium]|jgi:dephospho-CoA kinase|nr:dephospho-CoA kinase [Chloroflexia bacterium]
MKKTLIGLTGNIACGKSTVVRRLRELGAHTIDADALIHVILRRGGAAFEPVVEEFGEGILGHDGEIDRRALGRIVFSDPARLKRLEEIEHPIVRRMIEEEIRTADEQVVVVDAIKLFESGWAARADVVWVVTCEREQQIERLVSTRGYSREEVVMRIDAQSPQDEKVTKADVVIDNSGPLEETLRQVDEAWERLNKDSGRRNARQGEEQN